ncbi:BnaC03g30540D [Brassica napus]|uniref:BnaC03g30540D protein n=1 Tax=Brassica napus TaxID=3708 RepID=A0A078FYV6_BRANA|nr:BnaC03g30540D [Brassica napus]
MASLMLTVSTSPLIHPSIRNNAFMPRRCIDQIHLHTTPSIRGCTLSVRSSSSPDTGFTRIDGNKEAKSIRDEIKIEVSRMDASIHVVPGLAVILEDLQRGSFYPWNPCSVASTIAINPKKDVDGFHPQNMGLLAMRGREPDFVPCTPKGCIELLHRYNVEVEGKRAVVIGRSNIVGMPVAHLLQNEDATVTTIHSKTKNPEEIAREADILIAAAGQPNMVRGSWIKPGAVVIDVGINHIEDPSAPRGRRLVGDVCYQEACKVASAITPVPGGVGPMTIAMLLSNTLTSAKRIHEFE